MVTYWEHFPSQSQKLSQDTHADLGAKFKCGVRKNSLPKKVGLSLPRSPNIRSAFKRNEKLSDLRMGPSAPSNELNIISDRRTPPRQKRRSARFCGCQGRAAAPAPPLFCLTSFLWFPLRNIGQPLTLPSLPSAECGVETAKYARYAKLEPPSPRLRRSRR
jgi:hypothetical protein